MTADDQITIDRVNVAGAVQLVGEDGVFEGVGAGRRVLERRPLRADLAADPGLPDDTRLWAALPDVSGGPWGGSVFDVDAVLSVLAAGKRALREPVE